MCCMGFTNCFAASLADTSPNEMRRGFHRRVLCNDRNKRRRIPRHVSAGSEMNLSKRRACSIRGQRCRVASCCNVHLVRSSSSPIRRAPLALDNRYIWPADIKVNSRIVTFWPRVLAGAGLCGSEKDGRQAPEISRVAVRQQHPGDVHQGTGGLPPLINCLLLALVGFSHKQIISLTTTPPMLSYHADGESSVTAPRTEPLPA
jgi:hypothetical protein